MSRTPGGSQKYIDFIGIVNIIYFEKSSLNIMERH